MTKKFWFGMLVIGIPLLLLAQSIRWYNDAAIPQKTALTGNEIVSLQQTGPNAYRWAYLSDVRGGSSNAPIVNIYALSTYITTNYITNAYITLLTVTSNAYFYETNFVTYEFVTNLTVLNTLNVESNAYFFETNFNNYEITTNLTVVNNFAVESNAYFYQTNFNFYEITTNLLVTENIIVQSNLTVNNNITAKTAFVTNLVVQNATIFTNAWANAPTGNVDLALSDQNYTASGDMEITGVVNKSNTVVQNVLLTINASGANRTVYLTGTFAEGTGATSYVCTNGVPREIWIRYTPAFGGKTNVCAMSFWRP